MGVLLDGDPSDVRGFPTFACRVHRIHDAGFRGRSMFRLVA